MTHAIHNTLTQGWWQQAMTSPLMMRCAVIFIISATLFGVTLLFVRNLRVTRINLPRDNEGTATIEFALVFPIALFLALLLAQTTLVMSGNLYVHYAAFTATRAAIVQIPRDLAELDEPVNTIVTDYTSTKYTAIREAAAFALVPVSGRVAVGADIPADEFTQHMDSYFEQYGQTPPVWVDKLMAERLSYAYANTFVDVLTTVSDDSDAGMSLAMILPGDSYTFGPHEPVTVRVTHALNLSIPLASMVFADEQTEAIYNSGRYSVITAYYTLTNEGVDDAMPAEPPIPRLNVPD